MDVRRLLVYSPQERFLGEIAPGNVLERVRTEAVNGEHSLRLTCAAMLSKGQRLLSCDHTGRWREWVVNGEDKEHRSGDVRVGTYYLVWSLQYDLSLTRVYKMPGTQTPVAAGVALAAALDGTDRWGVGTVTVSSTGGASMWDKSGWQALAVLVSVWGGEVDANIAVGATGVVSRTVCLYDRIGNQTPTRRFDWSRDLSSVKRKVADGPWPCRVIPRGKGEATGNGGYGRRITIESVNGGVEWLQNDDAAELVKVPDGSGGWEYPSVEIENGDIEDPQELKDWALSVIHDYTEPQVTYTAGLVQMDQAGTGPKGVGLGDAIHVVDRGFCDGGLRIHARVMKLVTNELDESDITATMSKVGSTLADSFMALESQMRSIASLARSLEAGGTSAYLHNLLDRLNTEINATGGYWYAVPGIGSVTYDTEVSDPAVGSEATQATEMRGGTLRFANTKTASGDWNWTNVITADGYLALAATIARITAGSIGSPSGNYWNLDTGEFRMASTAKVGDQTLAQYIGDNLGLTQEEVFNLLTNNGAVQGLYMSNGQLYMNASYINSGAINASLITTGTLSANLITSGSMSADRITSGTMSASRINGGTLKLGGDNNASGLARVYNSSNNLIVELGYYGISLYHSDSYKTLIRPATYNSDNYLLVTNTSPNSKYARMHVGGSFGGQITVGDYTRGSDYYSEINTSTSTLLGSVKIGDCLKVGSTQWSQGTVVGTIYCCQLKASESGYGLVQAERLSVSGSKSRLVETEDYSDRLLYCYETPEPYFGDVGSATIGDDGTCVVSIDDIFQETARTDMAYQVFLQKCGPGDLWVAEKTPTHFVVEGTAGLPFDWEVKAHQVGYETERLEDARIDDEASSMGIAEPPSFKTYEDDLRYVQQIESLYEEAA